MAKILSIDDNLELQKIYQEVFVDAGHQFLFSLTGKEGIALARAEQPNIIILDVMLTDGSNGFDVLKDLKRHPDTGHIPVLALTNLDSEEKHALEMGAEIYLIKSNTTFDVLLQTIQRLSK